VLLELHPLFLGGPVGFGVLVAAVVVHSFRTVHTAVHIGCRALAFEVVEDSDLVDSLGTGEGVAYSSQVEEIALGVEMGCTGEVVLESFSDLCSAAALAVVVGLVDGDLVAEGLAGLQKLAGLLVAP